MTETATAPPALCCPPGLISVEQAREFILARARVLEEQEVVDVQASLGRVLAAAQRASIDVPGFANSSMDGYAMRSDDVAEPGPRSLTITQRVAAGGGRTELGAGEAARIFTGAPMPIGADTVVMQENCRVEGGTVTVTGPVPAAQHVRPKGNNVPAGEEVLPAGARMRPQEMGIAAAIGIDRLPVRRRLRVAFFSSGDELVEPGAPLAFGKIYNSNRFTLAGLLSGLGCEGIDLGIVEDSVAATRRLLAEAARCADVVVTSGGVSVGEEDHVKEALEAIGSLEMWQVAVKPGKPLTYGRIGEADFLGLPGNPVSTLVTFCLFVRPFLLKRLGARELSPCWVPVVSDFSWPVAGGRREYVRARLRADDAGVAKVALFPRQGSDVLASTVWASGLVEIREHTTVASGDVVPYLSFAELLS